MKSRLTIDCGPVRLEGILNQGSRQKAVVICHPHPLYGGNMDNPVVTAMEQAFFEQAFTTLRFNFRGAGNSTGQFDNGEAEQTDVRAAAAYLAQAKYERVCLAGYSFGARMTAGVVSTGFAVEDHIMVSPPAGFMSFDSIVHLPSTGLVVTGDRDDIAPVAVIQEHLSRWKISPEFAIIKNCDHFYSGCLGKLKTLLAEYLAAF